MAFQADGPAPVQEINEQEVAFSTSIILSSNFSFLMDSIFVGIWYAFLSTLRIRIIHLHKKEGLLKRELKKPLALMSSRASSSEVVILFAKVSSCKV